MGEQMPIGLSGRQVIVYRAPDGGPQVEVVLGDETVWLTRRQMADLFSTSVANVSLHARNAYDEGELSEGQLSRNP